VANLRRRPAGAPGRPGGILRRPAGTLGGTGGTVAENCSFTNPEAGTWHVRIEAYSASNGYNLTGTYDGDEPPPPPPPTQLDNGVTVGGIDVDAGEDLYYFIDVPEDASYVVWEDWLDFTGEGQTYLWEY